MPSPDGYLETYAEVNADTSRFDLPSGGMEVELMVPFLIRTIEKASRDKTEMVFVGFRFQWSNHRDQWIPGRITTYQKAMEGENLANTIVAVPTSF